MFIEIGTQQHSENAEEIDFEEKAQGEFYQDEVDANGWV